MKLNLNKEWYAERIPQEGDLDITAGVPADQRANDESKADDERQPIDLSAAQELSRKATG